MDGAMGQSGTQSYNVTTGSEAYLTERGQAGNIQSPTRPSEAQQGRGEASASQTSSVDLDILTRRGEIPQSPAEDRPAGGCQYCEGRDPEDCSFHEKHNRPRDDQ
jgi:hypothetical protein